jgi:hypothetical protein
MRNNEKIHPKSNKGRGKIIANALEAMRSYRRERRIS